RIGPGVLGPRPARTEGDRGSAAAARGRLARGGRAEVRGSASGVSAEVTNVSARVGGSNDVKEGHMRVFDVAGTNVNVANANGHLYGFDDTPALIWGVRSPTV